MANMFDTVNVPTGFTQGCWVKYIQEPGHRLVPITSDCALLEYEYWRPDGIQSSLYIKIDGRWWMLQSFADRPAADIDLRELARQNIDGLYRRMENQVLAAAYKHSANKITRQRLKDALNTIPTAKDDLELLEFEENITDGIGMMGGGTATTYANPIGVDDEAN